MMMCDLHLVFQGTGNRKLLTKLFPHSPPPDMASAVPLPIPHSPLPIPPHRRTAKPF